MATLEFLSTPISSIPLVAAALALNVGCAAAELAPISPNADGAAVARTSSVELRARVRPAHPDVPSSLTPIEISVKNLAPGDISVALDDIVLVTDDAAAKAVSPEAIRLRRPIGLGIDPASPFAASGTASSAAASGAARESGGPVYEPTVTYAAGPGADPRRREIVDGAFAGGSIDEGKTERGVVYFQAPMSEGERVNLRVVVHAGSDSGVSQVLEIPFEVQG